MWKSVVAISIGASLRALLRWWLGTQLNSLFPTIPPGTLVANLIGGYIIGLAIALFSSDTALSPEWRLFIVTGFCGGLTTFSTPFGRARGLDPARAATCNVCRCSSPSWRLRHHDVCGYWHDCMDQELRA